MNHAIGAVLTMMSLAACGTTSDGADALATTDAAAGTTAAAPTASFDTPKVTAPGTNPINPRNQLAFCQDQVADMFGAKREHTVTGERVVASDGGSTIDVTVFRDDEGVRTFKCRLDADGRFLEVVAATSETAL